MAGRHRRFVRSARVATAVSVAASAGVCLSPGAEAIPVPGHAPGLAAPAPVPGPVQQLSPQVSRAVQPLVVYQQAAVPTVVVNQTVLETSPGLLVLNPEAASKLDVQTVQRIFGSNIRESDVPVLLEAAAKSAAAGVALGIPVASMTGLGGAVVGATGGAVIGGVAGAAVGATAGAAVGATAGGAILGVAGTVVATPVGAVLVPPLPIVPGLAAGTVAAGIGAVGGGVIGGVVGGAIGMVGGAAVGGAVGGAIGAADGLAVGGAGAAVLGTGIGVATTPQLVPTAQRIAADVVWDLENETRIRNGYAPLAGNKPGDDLPAAAPASPAAGMSSGVDEAVDSVRAQVNDQLGMIESNLPVRLPRV